MKYTDIFNQNTINIFTDASITPKNENGYIGCPGCIVVVCDQYNNPTIIDMDYSVEYNSTNNNSEIKAIYKGVQKAIQYKNKYSFINLFSDSRICIQGLREWIFNWKNNIHNGFMYNSSGAQVSNQEVILNIIHSICNNNLNINLYHQKGHVNMTPKSLQNAANVFCTTNNINFVDSNLITKISEFNNYIDESTRKFLYNNLGNYPIIVNPIHRGPDKLDFDEYKKLIKGGC